MTKWVNKNKKSADEDSFRPDPRDKSSEFDFQRFDQGKIKVRDLRYKLKNEKSAFGETYKQLIRNPDDAEIQKKFTEHFKEFYETIGKLMEAIDEVYMETQKPDFSRHGIDGIEEIGLDEMLRRHNLRQ